MNNEMHIFLKVLKYIGFAILGIAFVLTAVFVTQYLWNWLIPELFNGPELSFWQTVGLFILSKILLTGISPGCSDKHNKKHDRHRKFHEKFKSHCKDERMHDEAEVI